MKIIQSLFVVGLIAVLGCDGGRKVAVDARIADKSRPLVFVTHPTAPPTCYLDEHGRCKGSAVELAQKIADKMNRKLVVEALEFEAMIPRLKAGTADFAIAAIAITDARKRDVNFSRPYAESGNSFMYVAGHERPRMSQIANFRIGSEGGTTSDLYLSVHDCDPIRFAHLNEALVPLQEGKLDAIFYDHILLKAWAEKSGGRFVVSAVEEREVHGVAVDKRRGDVLKAANEVIEAMRRENGGK